jgi:predicted nucleotidyltransferase
MENILDYFIAEPNKEYHIRELARIAKKSPATISKELKKLEEKKILVSQNKFNHLTFKPNLSKEFFFIKRDYNLKQIYDSGLIKFLEDLFNFPEAIVLFGSYEKGEDNEKSDIDILIVSNEKKETDLKKFEKILKKKIQIFVHSKKELDKLKEKNPELVNSWVNGKVIYGYWELFK